MNSLQIITALCEELNNITGPEYSFKVQEEDDLSTRGHKIVQYTRVLLYTPVCNNHTQSETVTTVTSIDAAGKLAQTPDLNLIEPTSVLDLWGDNLYIWPVGEMEPQSVPIASPDFWDRVLKIVKTLRTSPSASTLQERVSEAVARQPKYYHQRESSSSFEDSSGS